MTPRPVREIELIGRTHKIKVPAGTLYIVINKKEGKYHQVLINVSQTGSFLTPICEALGRMITLSLRFGASLEDCAKQLEGIKGSEPIWFEGEQVLSISDGVAKVLRRELKL